VTLTFVVRVLPNTGAVVILNQAQLSSLTVPGVTVSSNQVINPLSPTAITLDEFRAEMSQGGALVRWRTSLERNTLGFNLLRSNSGDRANATQVNAALIPALGPQGGAYELTDVNGIPGAFYWIEEVELSGATRIYGPVQVAGLGGAARSETPIPLGGQAIAAQPGAALAVVSGIAPAAPEAGQSVLPGNAVIVQPAAQASETQAKAMQPPVVERQEVEVAEPSAMPAASEPQAAQASVLTGQPSADELAAFAESQQRPQPAAASLPAAVIAGQQQQAGVVRGVSEPSQLSVPERAADMNPTSAHAASPSPAWLVAAVGVLALGMAIGGAAWVMRRRRKRA
jgi:hypothetical protein